MALPRYDSQLPVKSGRPLVNNKTGRYCHTGPLYFQAKKLVFLVVTQHALDFVF